MLPNPQRLIERPPSWPRGFPVPRPNTPPLGCYSIIRSSTFGESFATTDGISYFLGSLKIFLRKRLSQVSRVKSIRYSIGTDYCSSQAAATNGGGGGPNQFWETSVSAKWHSAPQARAYPTSNAHTLNTLNTLNTYTH